MLGSTRLLVSGPATDLLCWKILFGYVVFKSEAANDSSTIAHFFAVEDDMFESAGSNACKIGLSASAGIDMIRSVAWREAARGQLWFVWRLLGPSH